jgi:hypothetical protein
MQRMQEKCDEFAHEVMRLVPQEGDRDMLIDMMDSVSTEYVNLALKAVTFLSRLVLKDLEEDVFSRLYCPAWEASRDRGASVCGVLTATLKDYFIDVAEWLPPFFFYKFVRDVLTNAVLQYSMGLRKVAVASFQFGSELAAARSLLTDVEVLQEFFEQHLEALARAGLGSSAGSQDREGAGEGGDQAAAAALQDELLPMTHLARLVSATHISGALADAKGLYIRWGREGLRLVLCCISANPSMDRAEKQESTDLAQKTFDQVVEYGLIPRNSPSIAAALDFLGGGAAGASKGDLMGSVVDGLKRTGSTLRKTNWGMAAGKTAAGGMAAGKTAAGRMRGLVSSASTRDVMAGGVK